MLGERVEITATQTSSRLWRGVQAAQLRVWAAMDATEAELRWTHCPPPRAVADSTTGNSCAHVGYGDNYNFDSWLRTPDVRNHSIFFN